MADELIDIVDESGRTIDSVMKSQAHKQGLLHKTVIGYLRRGEDWTLIRQAADKQDAGQLVAPVGGHVASGESEETALLREAEEEIGTKDITYVLKGRSIFHRLVIGRDENHMFVVYEISTDKELVLNEESISAETFTADQLKHALEDNSKEFGEAFYFVLEKFYHDYLPKHWVDRY